MKKAFVSFLVLLFLVTFSSSAWSAITIGFEPASQTVDLGAQVSAALVISGLGNGTALVFSSDGVGGFVGGTAGYGGKATVCYYWLVSNTVKDCCTE